MSRTIEQEIQALTTAFVEDLAKLVRQHTLEIVLAQLEAGASPRPSARRQAAVEAGVVLRPRGPRREQRRRRGKALELEPVAVQEADEVAPEEPPQPEVASALPAAPPAELEETVAATV
jgi:hypothetical protein